MSTPTIQPTTTVAQSSTQISCMVDGTVMVMNAEESEFYDLNRPASEIWCLLQSPHQVDHLCEELCQRYDVEYEICEADVLVMLSRLNEKHLIRTIDLR